MIPEPCDRCSHWARAGEMVRQKAGFVGFSLRVETDERCLLELAPVSGECRKLSPGMPEVRGLYSEED